MRKKIPALLMLLVAAGAVLAACTFVKPMTNKSHNEMVYYGTAEAEQIDISTEINGIIKELKVEEGQKVSAGDIVAVIASPENLIKESQAEISVGSAENELQKVKEGSRQEEINMQKAAVRQAEAAVKQSEAAVSLAEQNVNIARETYDQKKEQYEDIKALFENDAATRQELDNAEHALNTASYALNGSEHSLEYARAQSEAAKAQLAAAEEKLGLLVNGTTQRNINSAEYAVAQAEKGLELSKLIRDKSNVRAFAGGIVETTNFNEGEYVGMGSPIVTLVNLNNLWVKIYVPESALPLVKLGKPVAIRSDFLKGKTIKGEITYISPEAEFTPVNVVTKEDRMKLVFAVKVKILDNLESIRPGMLLDVDIR